MMFDSIFKEAKELLKEKENEVTWFKIFTVFEKTSKLIDSENKAIDVLNNLSELLIRSIQSDRSRLNGIALDLLNKCVDIAQRSYNFNTFFPVVMKLTGKSNKVFVSRAMDSLLKICSFVDIKSIHKSILEYIDSPNKNVRYAVFKVIEYRFSENQDCFKQFIEKGLKDAAVEVRTVCKSISVPKKVVQEAPVEIKKSVVASNTPRKNIKIDLECAQIKKLEDDVIKIAKEHVVRKPINSDFFERLNMLKKERKFITEEKKDDDLTPRKLDQYLNKYRSAITAENTIRIEPLSRSACEKDGIDSNAKNALYQSTGTLSVNINEAEKTIFNHIHSNKEEAEVQKVFDETVLPLNNTKDNLDTENDGLVIDCDSFENTKIDTKDNRNTIQHQESLVSKDSSKDASECIHDIDDLKASFVHETIQFGREMNSSEHQNQSVIHELVIEDLPHPVPGSDNRAEQFDILNEYEDSLIINDELKNESIIEATEISELSRSFANIFIDQSKHSFLVQNSKKDFSINDAGIECEIQSNEEKQVLNQNEYSERNVECISIIDQYECIDCNEECKNDDCENDDCENDDCENDDCKNDDCNNGSNSHVSIEDKISCNNQIPIENQLLCDDQILEQDGIVALYNDANIEESTEHRRSDLYKIQQENMINSIGLQKSADYDKNIHNINTSFIEENNLDFENLCPDFNILQSLGNLSGDITGLITKASQNNSILNLENQDTTFCVKNSNETVVIESLLNRDSVNVFNQENIQKTSCVDLFNEPIFCSDEETSFLKKSSIMKEKPNFDFRINQNLEENDTSIRRNSI